MFSDSWKDSRAGVKNSCLDYGQGKIQSVCFGWSAFFFFFLGSRKKETERVGGTSAQSPEIRLRPPALPQAADEPTLQENVSPVQ